MTVSNMNDVSNLPKCPTELILLEPLTVNDSMIFQALFTSNQVMQFIQPPLNQKQAEEIFQLLLQPSSIEYLTVSIHYNFEQHKIGLATYCYDTQDASVEIGRMLLPQWQNQGLGRLISEVLISRAAQNSNVFQVKKRIHANNIAAIRSAHALGFILKQQLPDGYLRFIKLLRN